LVLVLVAGHDCANGVLVSDSRSRDRWWRRGIGQAASAAFPPQAAFGPAFMPGQRNNASHVVLSENAQARSRAFSLWWLQP
jgi:hypothetical protein